MENCSKNVNLVMKVVRLGKKIGYKFESEVENFRDRKSKNFQIDFNYSADSPISRSLFVISGQKRSETLRTLSKSGKKLRG